MPTLYQLPQKLSKSVPSWHLPNSSRVDLRGHPAVDVRGQAHRPPRDWHGGSPRVGQQDGRGYGAQRQQHCGLQEERQWDQQPKLYRGRYTGRKRDKRLTFAIYYSRDFWPSFRD